MNGPKEILSHASHEAAHVKMTSRSIVTLILAIDNDIRRLIRLSTFSELNMAQEKEWYKRAPIAAQRQAKFYLPRQAAVPQYTRYSFSLVYCGSCTSAKASRPQWSSGLIRHVFFELDRG